VSKDTEDQDETPVAASAASTTAPSRAERAIADLEALWTTHVADSPVSRNTRLYNLAHEAKEALKPFLSRLDDME
jgi:hypothetical protein